MNEKLSEQHMELIRRGHRVGNGAGAFFLRPILKTVLGCVWSRDWQNWFAPDALTATNANKICTEVEQILDQHLDAKQRALVYSLLPGRDKE